MVSKDILNQYSDLLEEVKETKDRIQKIEKQIERIEREGTVIDKVMGGEGGLEAFKIEGFPYPEYSKKKMLLYSRKSKLERLEMELLENINRVEEFISGIKDSRMRRIISLRYIENLSWNKVADYIGGGNTEGSIKMAFQRFMEKE